MRRRRLVAASLVAVALAVWIGIDLAAPRQTDLRDFDPDIVAKLETDMWRSYYSRQRFRLFLELGKLLREQYHAPLIRSNVMAFHAAKAAFVFKDGKGRADYERALPDLVRYYTAIRRMSATPFDVKRVAALELEWWIIHRERKNHALKDLDRSLAELQAAIYEMPVTKFMEHGRLRADAMRIRDDKAEAGEVTEADWNAIHELLRQSWHKLRNEVKEADARI
jgi:hypothetical protein